jgi:hypothetical protein
MKRTIFVLVIASILLGLALQSPMLLKSCQNTTTYTPSGQYENTYTDLYIIGVQYQAVLEPSVSLCRTH